MSESRLLEENGRRHFMTKRFDRRSSGEKVHMQSLGAMMHYDYNMPGVNSYEQAILTMRKLIMPIGAVEEQYRRAIFNVLARSQDDHVKNIAYLMNKSGDWSLSPAFDVTYAYNPDGPWTNKHQMSLNGKREGFEDADYAAFATSTGLKRGRDKVILEEVRSAISKWPVFAEQAGVKQRFREQIASLHRVQ